MVGHVTFTRIAFTQMGITLARFSLLQSAEC